MVPERHNLALALIVLFIVFVVPTFFIIGSAVESIGFIACLVIMSFDFNSIKNFVSIGISYLNPLKIVDGRYGMSGAWISAAPIGYIMFSWISANFGFFLNNSCVYDLCVNNV